MAHGAITATASSTALIAADAHREFLLIQKANATAIDLGFGEAAEANEGIRLTNPGDTVRVVGPLARLAVYGIGNGGTATWQDGDVEFQPAGPPAA